MRIILTKSIDHSTSIRLSLHSSICFGPELLFLSLTLTFGKEHCVSYLNFNVCVVNKFVLFLFLFLLLFLVLD